MSNQRWTEQAVRVLRIDDGPWVSVGDNLYLRIYKTRAGKVTKTWCYRTKSSFRGLGLSWPDTGLASARKAADRIRLGIKDVESTATFAMAAEEFYRARLAGQVKGKARKAILTNHVIPKIGNRKLRDLTKRDVADCLAKLANKHRTAREALRLIRMTLDYAMDRGWIDANPAATIKAASVGRASRPRTRRLSDDELAAFLKASYGHPRGHFARFVLATGLRLKEAQLAQKGWIKDRWLCLPASIMKIGRPHKVYLSDFALAQIEPGGEYLFGAIKVAGKPIAYRTAGRVTEEVSVVAKTDGIRTHDLRRTARSYWAELGVDPLVAEQMLSHTLPGLLATYDHANRQEPMKDAWITWGQKLEEVSYGQ